MAVLGHKTLAEAERYTREADQARLATEAMIKLEGRSTKRIIAILQGSPNGLTSNEIAQRLGATAGNISSRLSKLAAYGSRGVVASPLSRTHVARPAISDGTIDPRSDSIAAATRLPTVYGYREHVEAGGLISYGVNLDSGFHRAATYVYKILKGTPAADLPVEFPTKLELVINLKTARVLGLDVPPMLLARADEVIE